ncbi:type II secretion system protein GspL [Hydrocarboniphaga effusa]|uniref:type II secretion system protein GspL n=1 Tax=Hydrocarboniphaga effusa TaxID=243629 RepID=UPI003138026F
MREILYIRLPSGVPPDALIAAPVEFAVAPADRSGLSSVQHGTLEAALQQAAGRRLIVFVPGADVRLTSVTVPARQASKVLQAAPYQLEEQLAEDIDTLHFALGPRQADGSHPVAVVADELMRAWTAPFRERGLRLEALVPDTLALPWDPDQGRWSALCEAEQVVVRNAPFSGFHCAPDDLTSYLLMGDPDKSRALRLLTLSNAGLDYSRIDWPLELLPGYHWPLEVFAQHLQLSQAIDLLQGEYSQRQDLDRYWKPWRAAAILAVVAIALSATIYGIETWRLGQQLSAQDQANLARFQALFPNETRIVDLQVQLDQQMRALKGSGQDAGVFPLLEVMTQAVGANQGLKLQNLQFRDGALFVAMKASDLQVVERLREWFASQRAATLEVQSADAGTEGVQVRVKLTPV